MKIADRMLIHQVHPAKLLTDFATSFCSASLLWEQRWALAALVAFAPSFVVTALLVAFVDLEPWARTPIGRYVARFMTRKIEALRFAGQLVMWAGAVLHIAWLWPLGLMIVLYGWLCGLCLPSPTTT
ncbi:MAG TPA: hypothetical protein VGO62_06525 [Myxococcota bacterium]|jgi:hypothetical protein